MSDKIKLNELSLHILDIVQNSIRAGASLVRIFVNISTKENTLTITIKDNGSGFDVKNYEKAPNKSCTINGNKHGGYGISLFKESAEKAGGAFKITSKIGKGTEIIAVYILNNPCRLPLGDVNATIEALIFCCNNVDFVYTYKIDEESFTLSTMDLKKIMGEIPIKNLEVVNFIKSYLKENTQILNKNRFF